MLVAIRFKKDRRGKMTILYILGAVVSLISIAFLTIYIITEFPLRKKEFGFEFVYVDEDGSVRELYRDEIEFLNTEFSPADSGRPYIKYRYNERTPENKISGFIKRKRVPRHINIKPIDMDQARLTELYKHVK